MATYLREATRGRTLHLLKLDRNFGDVAVYLDATKKIKEAEKADKENGFENGGPEMAFEIEKARQYADYVAGHANVDNLHLFNTRSYLMFTDKTKPAAKPRKNTVKTDVRADVPV